MALVKCWDCGLKFSPSHDGDDICDSCFAWNDGYNDHLKDINKESIDGEKESNKP